MNYSYYHHHHYHYQKTIIIITTRPTINTTTEVVPLKLCTPTNVIGQPLSPQWEQSFLTLECSSSRSIGDGKQQTINHWFYYYYYCCFHCYLAIDFGGREEDVDLLSVHILSQVVTSSSTTTTKHHLLQMHVINDDNNNIY